MERKAIFKKYAIDVDQQISISKLLNKIEMVKKNHTIEFTDFISPELAQKCHLVLGEFIDIGSKSFGGYDEAEYIVFGIYPDYLEIFNEDFPMCLIEIEKTKFLEDATHRDLLGSLMGLGLQREKIGDIILGDDAIQVVVLQSVASYLEINFTRVGRVKVQPIVKPISEIKPIESEFRLINSTVKSLRLDAIITSGFNIARGKASDLIKADKVKINYSPVRSVSHTVNEGDLISVRGKGRIILEAIGGESKKERIRIVIKKYL